MLFSIKSYVQVIFLAGICFLQLRGATWHKTLPLIAQKVRQLALQKQSWGDDVLRANGITPDKVEGPANYEFLENYFDLVNTMKYAQGDADTQAFRHLRRLLFAKHSTRLQLTIREQLKHCLAEGLQDLETHFFAYLRDHVCTPSSVQLESQYEEELADMLTTMSCFAVNKEEIRRLVLQALSPWFQSAADKAELHNWFLKEGRFTKLYRDMFKFTDKLSESRTDDFYGQWYDRKWNGSALLCTKVDEENFCRRCLALLSFRVVNKKDLYISLSFAHNQYLLHKLVEKTLTRGN
jgi:hypothetical protein